MPIIIYVPIYMLPIKHFKSLKTFLLQKLWSQTVEYPSIPNGSILGFFCIQYKNYTSNISKESYTANN